MGERGRGHPAGWAMAVVRGDPPASSSRPNPVVRGVEVLGRPVLALHGIVEDLGRVARIGGLGLLDVVTPPVRFRLTVKQMEFIGVQSLPIIVRTSAFTGAVFTLRSHRAFALFEAEEMVGGTVGVALTRELGPTLTGLLVAGRAGSAMAAEIGSMQVSEQIDALEAMAVDPINDLVKPQMLAAMLVMPMLTALFDAVGISAAGSSARR